MEDFLEHQGYQDITGSRDTFREAFKQGLVSEEESWMKMIESRNITSHVYDEETANEFFKSNKEEYLSLYIDLQDRLKKEL